MKICLKGDLGHRSLGIAAAVSKLTGAKAVCSYRELEISVATVEALDRILVALEAEVHTERIDAILDLTQELERATAERDWEPPGIDEMLSDFKIMLDFRQLWVPLDDPTVAYAHPDDESPSYVAGPVDPPPASAETESVNHAAVARRYTDGDLAHMLTLANDAKTKGMTDVEVARHLNKRMLVPEVSVPYLLDKAQRRCATKADA